MPCVEGCVRTLPTSFPSCRAVLPPNWSTGQQLLISGIMFTYSKKRALWSCQEGIENQLLCKWPRWWASIRELGFIVPSLYGFHCERAEHDLQKRCQYRIERTATISQYRNWASLAAGNGIRYVPDHTKREGLPFKVKVLLFCTGYWFEIESTFVQRSKIITHLYLLTDIWIWGSVTKDKA